MSGMDNVLEGEELKVNMMLEDILEGRLEPSKELLKTVTCREEPVAFTLARFRWATDDPELLQMRWRNTTLAHWQAIHGWTTDDPKILRLLNKCGETVAEVIEWRKELASRYNDEEEEE